MVRASSSERLTSVVAGALAANVGAAIDFVGLQVQFSSSWQRVLLLRQVFVAPRKHAFSFVTAVSFAAQALQYMHGTRCGATLGQG